MARGVPALLLALVVTAVAGGGVARAALPVSSFGVQSGGATAPSDLPVASGSGAGTARWGEVFEGQTDDRLVASLARANVQLYPVLGVPCSSGSTSNCPVAWSPSPSVAAVEIAQVITAFAQRYGPGGSFWKENPTLPYLPVQRFEIGNEPNLPTKWVVDNSHLHWNDPAYGPGGPADYAMVYEAARAALHNVDPSGVAVVGGLADSARLGVDVQSDEQYLAALTPGGVDVVGYHPWVYDVSTSLLQPDTADLRVWMNANGLAGVPLNINELGACGTTAQTTHDYLCPPSISQSSAAWGAVVAGYVNWAMCTPWLGVDNVDAFWWGAAPATDQSIFLALVAGDGSLTAYGQDYLAEVKALTTTGCAGSSSTGAPPANTTSPTVQGNTLSGDQLTASPGTWTGDPMPTFSYQWESCDGAGRNCSSIGGANATTYTLQPADVGSTLVFSVTAINSVSGATAASAPTAVVTIGAVGSHAATSTITGPLSATSKTGATASMDMRVLRVVRRGRFVTITVRHRAGSGTLTVTATRQGRKPSQGRKRTRLRLRGHKTSSTITTFKAELRLGRWLLTVVGKPAPGYARPKPQRRKITLSKQNHVRA